MNKTFRFVFAGLIGIGLAGGRALATQEQNDPVQLAGDTTPLSDEYVRSLPYVLEVTYTDKKSGESETRYFDPTPIMNVILPVLIEPEYAHPWRAVDLEDLTVIPEDQCQRLMIEECASCNRRFGKKIGNSSYCKLFPEHGYMQMYFLTVNGNEEKAACTVCCFTTKRYFYLQPENPLSRFKLAICLIPQGERSEECEETN